MDWQERAAIRQSDGGLSRQEAEAGALWGAIVDSEPGRWRNVRHDDTGRSPHMKSKFIAAALALSSFAMFSGVAVAQRISNDLLAEYQALNYEKARRGAERGDAKAQFNLGLIFQRGLGVDRNDRAAFELFFEAAQQGYARAQHQLALAYANGQGIPQNYAEAVKWFRLAAEQGYGEAQYQLGLAYANGQGIPINFSDAEKWFRLAAEQGNASGQFQLGAMYKNGVGVPQNDAEAVKWFRLAAEQGNANAQHELGKSQE